MRRVVTGSRSSRSGSSGRGRLDSRFREARVEEGAPGEAPWRVAVHLRQVQEEEPFPVTVPVAVTIEGQEEPVWAEAGACARDCIVEVPCSARPLRVDVDPAFDVMRRLDPLEVPPALSTVFGAENQLFVLPASASDEEDGGLARARGRLGAARRTANRPRLRALRLCPTHRPGCSAGTIDSGQRLPADWPTRESRCMPASVVLAGDELPEERSFAGRGGACERRSNGCGLLGDGGADRSHTRSRPQAAPLHPLLLPRLSWAGARKHGQGHVAAAVLAAWCVIYRTANMPPLKLPARAPLAELPPAYDAQSLKRTVAELADPALEGRGLGSDGLQRATAVVEARLGSAGLEPAGDDGFRQSWRWTGGEPAREMELVNLVARIPGRDPKLAQRAGSGPCPPRPSRSRLAGCARGQRKPSPPGCRRQRLRGGRAARARAGDGRRAATAAPRCFCGCHRRGGRAARLAPSPGVDGAG